MTVPNPDMPAIEVETKTGTVTISNQHLSHLEWSLLAGFDVLRSKRGLPYDAVMLACMVAAGRSIHLAYALFKYADENLLTSYQDTRDQTRYTMEGQYEPFTERYLEVREQTEALLDAGLKVRVNAGDTVRCRVMYDLVKEGYAQRKPGGYVASDVSTPLPNLGGDE